MLKRLSCMSTGSSDHCGTAPAFLHDFWDITSSFESWSCTWICGAVTDTTHNLAQVGMKTEDHDTYFCDGSGSYILLQYEKIWITD